MIPAPQPALLRVLYRHKPVLVLLPLLCGILSAMIVGIMPEKYEAYGLVQIMPQHEIPGLKPLNPPVALNDSVVLSQVEIIRSPSLLRYVATDLKIPVSALRRAIDVRPLGRSYIIRISARTSDPAQAQDIVNHLITSYQENQIGSKILFAGQQSEWLKKHLTRLSDKARESAQKIEAYRSEQGLFAETGNSVSNQQIAALSAQLIQAQAQQAAIDAQPVKSGDAVMTAQLNSPIMHSLSQDETLLKQKLGVLQQKYGPKHPQLQAARAELGALQAKSQQEVSRIKTGLQEEKTLIADKIKNIQDQLEVLKQQQYTENRSSIPLHELEREEKINRLLYENFLRQSHEIDLIDGLQQADSRIVSLAERPVYPSRPAILLIMALSAVGGFLIACFTVILSEQLGQTIQSPDQLHQAWSQIPVHPIDFRDPDPNNQLYQSFLNKNAIPSPIILNYTREADRHYAKLFASFLGTQLQKQYPAMTVASQFLQVPPDQTSDLRHYIIIREGFTRLYDVHLAIGQLGQNTEVIYLWT